MDGHNQILRYLTFTLPLLSSTFGSEVYISCATTILRYQDGHFTQPIKQGLGRVVSLAVDSDLGILFWSDVSAAKRGIYRTKIGDFTKVERIISDVDVVNGIGLDPDRGHVYWTDESRGTLEVARYDGTDRVVLLVDQFGLPRGVAVQATDGYLFWGDQGTGHIHRSRLDGSERAILLNDTIWPNAVVWDSYRSSLLWVDGWTNKMMTSTGDGDTQAIFSDLSILTNESSLFGLTVDSGQYMATLRDGRIFLLSTNGELSRVMEVGDLQNCTDLFAIVARRTEVDVKVSVPCGTKKANPCAHMCLPTDQYGYQCTCPTYGGYSLADDRLCEIPSEILLYTSAKNGEVGFIDLNKPTEMQRTLIGRARQPMGLAYDPVEQAVFYSDIKESRIYRVLFNGSGAQVFLSADDGVGLVDDLAVDYVQRHLYFTNYGIVMCNGSVYSWHKVEMVNLRDRSRYILTNMATKPHALSLDLLHGLVYFADRDNGSDFLWQMNMAGFQQKKIILDINGDIQINSISISSSNSALYFVASDLTSSDQSWCVYEISLVNLGSNLKTRRLEISLTGAADVTSMGFSLFWTDQVENSVMSYERKSGIISVLQNRLSADKIKYTRQEVSWTEIEVCSTDGTNCFGDCVRTAEGAPSSPTNTCLCPVGGMHVFNSETLSCDEPPMSVVFADVDSIKLFPYWQSSFAVPLTVHTIYQRAFRDSNIVGLAYDTDTDLLYFSDGNRGSIYVKNTRTNKRWRFFDSRDLPPMSRRHPQVIDSLSLDKVTNPKRLLWTSYAEGLICAMDTSGSNATYRQLIKGLQQPRALIVDEYAKMLYWSECGADGKIRGATLAGENVVTVFEDGLTWPNSILLNPETHQMYIADGADGRIYICDSNETEWSCGMLNNSGGIMHIFSILLLDEYLYLTSWQPPSVDRLNLVTGVRDVVVQGLTRPTQMLAIPTKKRSRGCENNRSDCGFSEKLGGRDSSMDKYLLFGLLGAFLTIIFVVVAVVLWRKKDCLIHRDVDDGRRQTDHTILVTHQHSPEPCSPTDKLAAHFAEHQL